MCISPRRKTENKRRIMKTQNDAFRVHFEKILCVKLTDKSLAQKKAKSSLWTSKPLQKRYFSVNRNVLTFTSLWWRCWPWNDLPFSIYGFSPFDFPIASHKHGRQKGKKKNLQSVIYINFSWRIINSWREKNPRIMRYNFQAYEGGRKKKPA